jgi:hypothetical protein
MQEYGAPIPRPPQKARKTRMQQITDMISELIDVCFSSSFSRQYESCPEFVKQTVLQTVWEGFSENLDLEVALKKHDFVSIKKLLEDKLCDDAVIPSALAHELRKEMEDTFAADQCGFKLEKIRIMCLKLYIVINKA